jgi:hypothetical protein
LGEILVARGALREEDLALVLAEQERTRRPLGELVVALGYTSSLAVHAALAEQKGWMSVEPPPIKAPNTGESPPRQADTERHLLLVPTPAGYQLLERPGAPPSAGATIELPQATGTLRYRVLKTTRAPLPASALRCAYLQAL